MFMFEDILTQSDPGDILSLQARDGGTAIDLGLDFSGNVAGYAVNRAPRYGLVSSPPEPLQPVPSGPVYLASDDSAFITGQALVIDGGWSI